MVMFRCFFSLFDLSFRTFFRLVDAMWSSIEFHFHMSYARVCPTGLDYQTQLTQIYHSQLDCAISIDYETHLTKIYHTQLDCYQHRLWDPSDKNLPYPIRLCYHQRLSDPSTTTKWIILAIQLSVSQFLYHHNIWYIDNCTYNILCEIPIFCTVLFETDSPIHHRSMQGTPVE